MKQLKNVRMLIPIIGIIIFSILYLLASNYYPGGSQTDKHSTGFNWKHNYWCNLLDEVAINKQANSARPIAITGLLVLCFSLGWFWYYFPDNIKSGKKVKILIRYAGVLSMLCAFFLYTDLDHDFITNLASFFGLIALIGSLTSLYQNKLNMLFIWGILNLLLVLINSYFYYSTDLIVYLPIVQKISFTLFLSWIVVLSIMVYHRRWDSEVESF